MFAISFLVAGACNMQAPADPTSASPDLRTQALIGLCIDTTLALDPGLNGDRYDVDLSKIKTWSLNDKKKVLQSRRVKETNLDSLLRHDSTWLQYAYLETPVIRIESIDTLPDSTLRIQTFKIKASDGAIRTEIIVRPAGNRFECISRRITRIS